MNPESQRIAIAEACGIVSKDQWGPLYRTQQGVVRDCPNYINDLNAMHEAEMSQVDIEEGRFIALFREYLHTILGHDGSLAIHATAAQRAEAFLKCIGLWRSGE